MPMNRGLNRFSGPTQPGQFPWARLINGSGTLANRPPAAPFNAGFLYLATDIAGGTLYRSTGSAWVQVAHGVTAVDSVTLTQPAAGITVTNTGVTQTGAATGTFALANDLAALEALAGTNNIYYRSGADTWTAVTIGSSLLFSAGTLDVATVIAQAETVRLTDASVSTQNPVLTVAHSSSGTPANGLGPIVVLAAESSTTDDRKQAGIGAEWVDVTDATRIGRGYLHAYNTNTNPIPCMTWRASTSGGTTPQIGFLGAGPSSAQTGDAGTALVTFGLMTGTPTFAAANLTGTSLPSGLVAAQSDQETATSTVLAVTPGRQQFHPSAAKAWVNFNGTGTVAIRVSYNVSSITDNGVGDYTVNFTTAFSSANYAASIMVGGTVAGVVCGIIAAGVAPTASALRVVTLNTSFAAIDPAYVMVTAFGDQ